MGDSAGGRWLKIVGIAGGAAVAAYAGVKLVSSLARNPGVAHWFNRAAEAVDQSVGWDRLPVPLGLLTLLGLRHTLREQNLSDTEAANPVDTPAPTPDRPHLKARTPDGTYNDLGNPRMGSAGTRFGRNVPLAETYPDPEPALLSPSPRVVSQELLTRHTFQPATTLNLLAAAWLQFMIRDWLSHGKSEKENPWLIPLPPDDDWHENPMRILRTRRDPTRTPAEEGTPPTYVNTESHWWDASQIYGSSKEFQDQVRTGEDGKLRGDRDQMVNPDPQSLVQQAQLAGWWVGLSLMFTLFTHEHNAICDRLRAEYPSWSDDDLFEHARLINAALLAKIHTVEWTTAILGHPTMQIGMRANWWGVAGERIHRLLGRISSSEAISGIVGSHTDHFGVPYSLTEEFVAVYRMHPLIPDELQFHAASSGGALGERSFPEVAGLHAQTICGQFTMPDLLYSFGLMHPGAITLHNYPRSLQRFERPDGIVIDLAAHDILRTRELGVPRYNRFRELLHRRPVRTFEELTDNPVWAEELRRVYEGEIDRVDLMVGLYAEHPPPGFGFSDTAFRIFILMASRRLNSDRFFTTDFTPEVYTPVGMRWIDDNSMSTVLLRHYPGLEPALRGVKNAFAPWARVGG
jgi:heme peroxidase